MTMPNRDQVYIIAEAGVNHNGSLDLALQMIDVAAEAGVDAIKFQTFKAERLVSMNAQKAEYQTKTTETSESQFEMLKKLEIDEAAHLELIDRCQQRGIQFLSTPFDLESVDLLAVSLDLPILKIPSGEITNAPLLLKAASTDKPVILSSGMCTLADIESALGVLAFGYLHTNNPPSNIAFQEAFRSTEGQQALRKRVTLLHCTTEYPAPFQEVNLYAMDTISVAFGLPVGFSDHTEGIVVPIAAVALGAVVIEKHFTLDRNLPGPDHKASLEPDELRQLVQSIRQVEQALGSKLKLPSPSEIKNMTAARKSIFAAMDIRAGELFTSFNLTVKRPGNGMSPLFFYELLGKKADRDFAFDEEITL